MARHNSLEMVQRYAHLAPEFQEAAIAVLDQRPTVTQEVSEGTKCHDLVTLGEKEPDHFPSKSLKEMVPLARFELATPALRMRCSTN